MIVKGIGTDVAGLEIILRVFCEDYNWKIEIKFAFNFII